MHIKIVCDLLFIKMLIFIFLHDLEVGVLIVSAPVGVLYFEEPLVGAFCVFP